MTVESNLIKISVDISLTLGVRTMVGNASSNIVQNASCFHYIPSCHYDIHGGVERTNSSVQERIVSYWVNGMWGPYLVKSDMSAIIPHISLASRTISFSLSSHLLTSASNLNSEHVVTQCKVVLTSTQYSSSYIHRTHADNFVSK